MTKKSTAKSNRKSTKKQSKSAVVPDVKMAAAHDVQPEPETPKTKAAPAVAEPKPEKQPRKKAEPKAPLPPSVVSANRKEGLRLFSLAGKPKPEQFIAVFGEKGAKMTWVERAKAAGFATAEETATKFQSMLVAALASKSGHVTTTTTTAAPQTGR